MNRRSLLSVAALVAISAFVAWGWLAMMLLHELGHVAAASATGGRIASVELRPGWLSHTLVAPNPCPSVVVWSGLASGWIAPQLTAPLWRIERFAAGPLLRAWAAFCLLGTGSYLAIGGGERLTDTGQLIDAGWPHTAIVAIGGGVAVLGYVRFRGAVAAVNERLVRSPLGWRDATVWFGLLAAWCVGQGGLHVVLQP